MIEIIKRLLLSFIIVIVVGASAVQATQALLSDSSTLTANTFSTGTADLQVCNGKTCTDYKDTAAGFADTVLPGQTISEYLRVKNSSSGVDFIITGQAVNISGAIDPSDVTIAFTPVDSSFNPTGSAVSHTLTAWVSTPTGIPPVVAKNGSIQRYKMDVTFSPSITATGSATFDFVFTGTQTP